MCQYPERETCNRETNGRCSGCDEGHKTKATAGRKSLNEKPKVGTEIIWRTRFGQYFKGIIRRIEADHYVVDRTAPAGAFGVILSKETEITW